MVTRLFLIRLQSRNIILLTVSIIFIGQDFQLFKNLMFDLEGEAEDKCLLCFLCSEQDAVALALRICVREYPPQIAAGFPVILRFFVGFLGVYSNFRTVS